ncbi:hypothetical protein QJS64_13400 [Paraclostridium bifermentans]|uniref:Uncharacterized protein n=1 Tax=Paraclostridium bifermentans TaxID=1490 RepID=A0ABY8R0L0_PARBF|nr:hypothetical protein QJS64_13400 [Paraclostridium bifermentans]
MNKNRLKESMLKVPLVYNIVTANIKDSNIQSYDASYGNHKKQYYKFFNFDDKSPIIFLFMEEVGGMEVQRDILI